MEHEPTTEEKKAKKQFESLGIKTPPDAEFRIERIGGTQGGLYAVKDRGDGNSVRLVIEKDPNPFGET